jgi:DNA-binding HxlR family transcriptional regulator
MENSSILEDELVSPPSPAASTHRQVTLNAASCPLDLAINIIGGRWKLHILRALLLIGPLRYNALLAAVEGISAKELTRNLRELETARLVESVAVEGRAAYALTALGCEIEPSFRALGIFGAALAKR